MKSLSRVVWSEGMYLSPQHFQAQSRFYEDTIDFVARALWPEPWGLLHARLDEDALRNGRLVLLEAAGVFEDGLVFQTRGNTAATPTRRAEEIFLPTDASLVLHLAVPGLHASGQLYSELASIGANTEATSGADAGTAKNGHSFRFRAITGRLRDNTNGVDEREVTLGEGNLMLLSEREVSAEMPAIPVARLLRDGRGGLLYDPEFMAPTLRMAASPPLMLLAKRLLEAVAEKMEPLTRATHKRARFEAGTGALDVASYWFLHALSTAAPVLRHLYATRHAHPEQFFMELSRLAGSLCTFATGNALEQLPTYDHRDPGPGFRALDAHIRRHLEIVAPSNTVTLEFTPGEPYIQEAPVADERCLRRARWIFGIRSDLGEAD
ncbi:MAG TPA: type VI secretion system baseplate subunit TssK, partial [Acidobacteriaceae bacterium]